MSQAKVSALTNAAKISQLIDKNNNNNTNTNNCAQTPAPTNVNQNIAKNGTNSTVDFSSNKWRYDTWRTIKPSINSDDEDADDNENNNHDEKENNKVRKSRVGSEITFLDCRAVSFKMAIKNADKLCKEKVRRNLLERNAKYDDLIATMAQIKIESNTRQQNVLKANLLKKEEEILEAVRKYEEDAKHTAESTKLEMQEHNKKMIEQKYRLKRAEEIRGYFEAIKSAKNLFIMLFEKYAKNVLVNQQNLTHFNEYKLQREIFLTKYELIMGFVNGGQISPQEVDSLEQLCDEVKKWHIVVNEEVANNAEKLEKLMIERTKAVAQQQEELQRQQQEQIDKQQQLLQQQQQQQQQQQEQRNRAADIVDSDNKAQQQQQQTIISSVDDLQQFINPQRLLWYQQIMSFYEEFAQSVKPLQADESMKKFRFNCQKAVNIPLNAISAVSRQHLQDKFEKLTSLLSGRPVKVGDVQISSTDHPLGVRFCTLLVAKKLVNQADSIVSSNPASAFPIASIIIAIWQQFPDIGYLFLAYLYKECPYLVPYYIPQIEGQTADEYLKLLGYRYTDGVLEKQDQYLKRMSGIIRLYSSILITKPRYGQTAVHPYGISNGWIWLTNILNLEPLPDICATMIQEFLLIAGAEMWRAYGKQFQKLLLTIYHQYMVKLNKVDEGGPKTRLEVLLGKILKEGHIPPPEGLLKPDFW